MKAFRNLLCTSDIRTLLLEQVPLWYTKKLCNLCDKYFADSKCLKKHVQVPDIHHGFLLPSDLIFTEKIKKKHLCKEVPNTARAFQ